MRLNIKQLRKLIREEIEKVGYNKSMENNKTFDFSNIGFSTQEIDPNDENTAFIEIYQEGSQIEFRGKFYNSWRNISPSEIDTERSIVLKQQQLLKDLQSLHGVLYVFDNEVNEDPIDFHKYIEYLEYFIQSYN